MKIITLEEHFIDLELAKASAPTLNRLSPYFAAAFAAGNELYPPSQETLMEVGERRIADMDEHGITTQVLSCLWAQQAPADVAPALVSSWTHRASIPSWRRLAGCVSRSTSTRLCRPG